MYRADVFQPRAKFLSWCKPFAIPVSDLTPGEGISYSW